jgi:hypothetical protein
VSRHLHYIYDPALPGLRAKTGSRIGAFVHTGSIYTWKVWYQGSKVDIYFQGSAKTVAAAKNRVRAAVRTIEKHTGIEQRKQKQRSTVER